ncbi:hypothetical protein DFQ05_1713 [Winogradskyella wandonensis]|uniref:Lipocalin-like protein n=1 Tax=Winogradskyella wandonensis TaxID=1442586 RepID=A0A4R1KTR7_9FLAO|nr:hypothetical protein [Winogradskyella wandonensis]TCK67930.1 hypothetical protein DFQ05_1713 [Winogradskyella wandonensis]
MKTLKPILLLVLGVVFTMTSCRTEDDLSIDPPVEQTIEASSMVANLMSRTATNDGSSDNIIDSASCLSVQLPVTVTVNGIELVINDDDGYEDIEDIIDLFDDDVDSVVVSYPITVILTDYSTVVVNSDAELEALGENCLGENENDDDIECIDFQYPITASVFNANNDLIDTIVINNDNEMYDFIDDLDEFVAVTINFPITVIFADGNTQTVNSIQELENAIETADDTCDEDDDNDFDDDDCNDCTTNDLETVFADCAEWTVDKLERNDNDLEDNYVGYTFEFNNDGTILVTQGTNTFNGTWSAMGSGNNISVMINVTGLSDFNDNWNLHEIEQEPGEVKVDLRLGDDRLRFESDCTSGGTTVDDTALVNALTTGDWYVTYFFDDTDETADFSDYVFNFASDNTATATDTNGSTNGIWSTTSGDETVLGLNLNFGTTIPLDELADDWDVLEVTNDIIRLKDISGGDGSEDFLTFERTPFSGGNGNDNLTTILSDGLWVVASYTEDTDDQTANYSGYQLNFDSGGTVSASNGTNTNNGTWSVFSSGNQMALNFGTDIPFNEFNDDDWDVISVSDTQVVIQDVSGGGGGTDTLTLQKI